LYSGEIPNESQVKELTADLTSRSKLPAHVKAVLKSLHPNTHPMTALIAAVAALQTESKFATAYQKGVNKLDYW
jgi:citrate synthase